MSMSDILKTIADIQETDNGLVLSAPKLLKALATALDVGLFTEEDYDMIAKCFEDES